jgi:thioesterase domain-containing protein
MQDKHAIQEYLHRHIPLSFAMGVRVVEAEPRKVTLWAPLEPNINHRETVFGGSASALCLLAAWALVHFRLQYEGHPCRVVIHKNTMSYDKPIPSDFTAICTLENLETWNAFTLVLAKKGKARVTLPASLACGGEKVGSFEGTLVAIAQAPA